MLEQLFSSRTRVKLLRLFLINEGGSYFIREISRKVGEHINSVRRELTNLEKIGLVESFEQKKKKYYKVNVDYILYPELKSLIFKAQILFEKNFIKKMEKMGRIKLLVLTGFFTGMNDVVTDILIVGSLNRKKLRKLIKDFQKNFDRELHYTVMSNIEFDYRNNLTDRFLFNILENKKIVVIDKREGNVY